MLTYAQQHQMSIEQVKAELAKVAMQTQTQKEIKQMEMQMDAIEAERGRRHDINMHGLQQATARAAQPAPLEQ